MTETNPTPEADPFVPPVPPAQAALAEEPDVTTPPAPKAQPNLAELLAQNPALAAQLTELLEKRGAADIRPPRPVPDLNEWVTYTYAGEFGPITKLALVRSVDAENRKVLVNWIPDAQAEILVDDLDD